MITTVFSGGSPTGVMYSLIPATPEGDKIDLSDNAENPDLKRQKEMYGICILLLVLAVICIPLMLLVKPLCCRPQHHDHAAVEEADFSNIAVVEQKKVNNAINDEDYDQAEDMI
jgi:hypothetical protein